MTRKPRAMQIPRVQQTREGAGKFVPISVSVHDTRAPTRSVVHQIDSSFQCLTRLANDAVSNLSIKLKQVKKS